MIGDQKKKRLAEASERYRDRKRAAKRAKLDLMRQQRPKFTIQDLAWAAGHFEGEGTCTITRSGGHHTASFVCLTSTDKEVIDFFDARWSSTRIRTIAGTDRHKEKYEWRLSGERMRNFLLDIRSYLVTEKRKDLFDLAIEAFDARRRGSRDPDYPLKMNLYRARMAVLNRKGPPLELEYASGRAIDLLAAPEN